jgi:predicted Zn-dependent peptidase
MTGPMAGEGIRRTRLGSGLRVVTEQLPGLRSVAVGFWVGTGSRDERDDDAGVSHFLEHLLFKGTASRDAAAIARCVESVGGDMNAHTGQETTAYYVRVPDKHVDVAIDVLSDIVWSPALRDGDIESERHVILEEIRLRDDTPDDLVHDVFAGALFPGHPLGREVAGTEATIGSMTRDALAGHHREHYVPENLVVAVAGNVTHDEVVAALRGRERAASTGRPVRSNGADATRPSPLSVREHASEQAHVVLGTRALARDDPDRFALGVLDQVLGGGMSSRLFQEVRERRGLAYSVFSYRSAYEETGALAVYAGTAPERVDEVLGVLGDELDRIVRDGGVTDRELGAAKGYLTGSLALSLESSASRMHRLGRSELTLGEVPTLDEVVTEVEGVTAADVERVVDRVLRERPRTLAAVGPVDAARLRSHT